MSSSTGAITVGAEQRAGGTARADKSEQPLALFGREQIGHE